MIRIGKMTDYGIVLLSYFAHDPKRTVRNARELAELANLPYPTVSKILKGLSRGGLLVSLRGVSGGYRLSKPAKDISMADVINLLEGPVAMTECSSSAPGLCEIESTCPIRSNWRIITMAVLGALKDLSLADMAKPLPTRLPTQSLFLISGGEK